MSEILVLGYNAFDVVVPAPDRLEADGKHEVADIVPGGGGPAATAAVALARLGAGVRLVTPLSDDLWGLRQRQELLDAGVDVSFCPSRPGHRSPLSVILVDPAAGTRTILWSRGSLPPLSPAEIDPAWLDGCRLLFLDSHEIAAAAALAGEARRRGLPVVLDGGTARPGAAALAALCTDVVSSRIFAPALTGCAEPAAALRALARLGPARVAMTFGAAGCLALEAGRIVHVPAFEVPVLDTTGAGDVFHAGYAFALLRGRPWLEALAYGAAAAALKCRDWGGRRGLPVAAEVEALLAHGRRRAESPLAP